jgi:hypothetical protein
VFKAKESAGKSGSFFFFSHDNKFLIKTMNEDEFETFRGVLPQYLLHFAENPNSLIARTYGILTVQMEDIAPVHLFMQKSCKLGCGPFIENAFDLKGSTIARLEKNPDASLLKDVNLTNLCEKKSFLRFRGEDIRQIVPQMR